MFSCVRQSAVRRVPLLTRGVASTYTRPNDQPIQASARAEESEDQFGKLSAVLNEEAVKMEARREVDNSPWKPFRQHNFIRPHELTYDNLRRTPRHYPKRSNVGLPRREAVKTDEFHKLGINPLTQSLNPGLLCSYVTEMGKILPRSETLLTLSNQRRLGKAIRRAKMMGVIPMHSKRNILGGAGGTR